MSVAQDINDYISQMRPKKLCNACIVKGLHLTQAAHAAQNTIALGTTSDFARNKDQCGLCGHIRIVISAN